MLNLFKKSDKILLSSYFCLLLLGLYFVMDIASYGHMFKFIKQTIWVLFSFLAIWVAFEFDLDNLKKYVFPMIVLVALLLILVLLVGEHIRGARRLLHVSFISFQPSLLARIVLIFYFAYILDKKKASDIRNFKDFLSQYNQLIFISILFFSLILAGRHLSILIVLGFSLLMMLIAAGLKRKIILTILLILLVLVGAVIGIGAKFRMQRIGVYQKYNLLTNKDSTFIFSKGEDYSTKQSLMALASGGFWGSEGRAKDANLPEADTDYIFSVIAEEFGFVGGFFVLMLYAFIYFRTLKLVSSQNNLYKKLLAVGLVHNIFYNAIVHIGVTTSMLPATGITLPFISYGGTSMLVNSFSIGLLLNLTKKED